MVFVTLEIQLIVSLLPDYYKKSALSRILHQTIALFCTEPLHLILFNRNVSWLNLSKIGCPEKLVNMVGDLHQNMKTRVIFGGMFSEAFTVENYVKPGDIDSPLCFDIYLDVMMLHAFQEFEKCICIIYQRTTNVLNLTKLIYTTTDFSSLIRERL